MESPAIIGREEQGRKKLEGERRLLLMASLVSELMRSRQGVQ
jgi:hypothetical protein